MNKLINFIKGNLFMVIVVLAYIILTIVNPQLGLQGIKNSKYYIIEMLMIMPVIFVLTALLDTWIPKETIMKFLGKDAKIKGVILSFLFGSVSAGPIYAAFPFCVMLHKKGASIKNIIIILSSWAVIKIPMLLNEAKFLGPKFMMIRWILTIIAILIFSWIGSKIIKDEDLPQENEEEKAEIYINEKACMGCTVCTKKYPELFIMDGKKASLKKYVIYDSERLRDTVMSCPVKAIQLNNI
ncbi:permease [Anaerosacchariphilus polymeriproducens]|uniref:Permease n=1 Tax=Anaerosacchariphilus polymeriproducens TaxID=1812858 RepID=A0A371ARR0_9FIRM|nr:permease [Anaerosacchariphilus polymeriproducens]RDU22247.1 permease [Anaerosacchariphilus polymeriproducens]